MYKVVSKFNQLTIIANDIIEAVILFRKRTGDNNEEILFIQKIDR